MDKSALVHDFGARELGIAIPHLSYITAETAARWEKEGWGPVKADDGNKYSYPLVLKTARGVAGQGVRIISLPSKMTRGYLDLEVHATGGFMDGAVRGDVSIFVEQYFSGPAAMLNVAALHGRVLCAYSLWKNLTDSPTGPSQLNTVLHNEEIVAVAMVAALGYNGMIGFEFMIHDNHAYLIDVNPRINTGSIHPLHVYGILPLDIPTALRIGLQDPMDTRLGVHVPDLVRAKRAPAFLK